MNGLRRSDCILDFKVKLLQKGYEVILIFYGINISKLEGSG